MSIIHDALKKSAQREQSPKPNAAPAVGTPVFSDPEPVAKIEDLPVERLRPAPTQAKSVFTLIFAVAFILAAFYFLFRQINTTFPNLGTKIEETCYKILRKEMPRPNASPLPPLAKITVTAPVVPAAKAPAPAPAPAMAAAASAPERNSPLEKQGTAPSNPAASAPAGTPTPAPTPTTTVVQDNASPGAPVTLNIHGVMANGSSYAVLINDQVYQEGDEVDGVKIIKISLDSIVVNNNGKEQTIPVNN